jgi:acyl-CoA thioesterase FadM
VTAWSTQLELDDGDTDYLGHITAAAHLALFERARTAWLAQVTGEVLPAFVVVRQALDYHRELLLAAGPVTIALRPLALTRSTVTVHETMTPAQGTTTTESRAVLVRWDREQRRSMPFSALERERIDAR